MQLEPGEIFAIVRELADPNDTGTYYVRAVIRNARTNSVIETVDLTDQGSGRFSKEWQVVSVAQFPLYISITTTVYTDSGYTALSDMYSREVDTYLVDTRDKHFGGGGGSVSYNKIAEVVRNVLLERDSNKTKEDKLTADQVAVAVGKIINKATDDVIKSRKSGLSPDEIRSIVKSEIKNLGELAKKNDLELFKNSLNKSLQEIPDSFDGKLLPIEQAIKNIPDIDTDKILKLITDSIKENSTTFEKAFNNAVMAIATTLVKAIPTAFMEAVSGEIKNNIEKYGHRPEEKKISPYAEMSTAELIKFANRKK